MTTEYAAAREQIAANAAALKEAAADMGFAWVRKDPNKSHTAGKWYGETADGQFRALTAPEARKLNPLNNGAAGCYVTRTRLYAEKA